MPKMTITHQDHSESSHSEMLPVNNSDSDSGNIEMDTH